MQNILNKKIPSILGLLIIGIGVFTTTALVKGDEIYQTYAVPGDEPENIQLSNISDSSFTVTYTTNKPTIGSIRFGDSPDSLSQTYLEDRDRASQHLSNYKTHSITVGGLESNSIYYFEIISGNVVRSNNGTPFNIKTASPLTSENFSNSHLSGNAINPDGSIPQDALVIVAINGAQKISSPLDKSGKYNIPLNNLRAEDLNSYFEINESSLINIRIDSSDYSSLARTSSNNITSIPTITLSKNYDFSSEEEAPKRQVNSENIKFPEFNSNLRRNSSVSVSPAKNPSPLPSPIASPTQ